MEPVLGKSQNLGVEGQWQEENSRVARWKIQK